MGIIIKTTLLLSTTTEFNPQKTYRANFKRICLLYNSNTPVKRVFALEKQSLCRGVVWFLWGNSVS